jgi:tetratricopeptide (TPR) repeat protein
MLETIREFGQERLADDGDLERIRRRHAGHFLDLAIAAEPHLTGADQGEWLDRCDLEQANLRAALRWAIDAGEAGRAQAAAGALWRFWQQRGHLAEGWRRLEEVLAMPSGRAPTAARARALAGAGGDRLVAGGHRRRPGFYEEALAIERELGDPARTADALYNLAFVAGAERDFEGAFRLLEESLELFRRAGDEAGGGPGRLDDRHPGPGRRPLGGPARHGRGDRGHRAPDRGAVPARGRPGLAGRRLRPRRPPGRRRAAMGEAKARARLSADAADRAWEVGRTSGIDAAPTSATGTA